MSTMTNTDKLLELERLKRQRDILLNAPSATWFKERKEREYVESRIDQLTDELGL